jgi:hypothetical protein
VEKLDGDGADDLIVVNRDDNSVSILHGDGFGGFSHIADLPVGVHPWVAAAADVTSDGILDLAVANLEGSSVSILHGDGQGSFEFPSTDVPVGYYPQAVALEDLNADGQLDLVAGLGLDRFLIIFRGNGLGQFARTDVVLSGSSPLSILARDFNTDGALDLAVANGSGRAVTLHFGDGVGGFARIPTLARGHGDLAAADLNGDGFADVVATSGSISSIGEEARIRVFVGDGSGSLKIGSEVELGGCPGELSLADFNADGIRDLAVANGGSDCGVTPTADQVNILLGDGQGSFVHAFDAPIESRPRAIDTGDFDGDGALDLAVTRLGPPNDPQPDFVTILHGDGTGRFLTSADITVGDVPDTVAADDFNNDCKSDLVVANLFSRTLTVLIANGEGGFSRDEIELHELPDPILVYDFNADGAKDLAVGLWGNGSVVLLQGDGLGGFSLATEISAPGRPESMAIDDLNADGLPDLVVDAGPLHLFMGEDNRVFFQIAELVAAARDKHLTTADLNNDGLPDLVLLNQGFGVAPNISPDPIMLVQGVGTLLNQLPARSDVNGSNRIDGFDVTAVSRLAGCARTDPCYRRDIDVDLNGWIDGDDLTRVGVRFGDLNRRFSPLRGAVQESSPIATPDTVTFQQASSVADLLTVDVLVDDSDDPTAAAAFGVTFDPVDSVAARVLDFLRIEPGDYLSGDIGQALAVDPSTPGRVEVRVSRLPSEARVGAGPQSLMSLIFRARREGRARLDFAPAAGASRPALFDAVGSEVLGVSFIGGATVEVDTSDADVPGQKIGVAPAGLKFGNIAPNPKARKNLRISSFGFSDLEIQGVVSELPEYSSFFTEPFTIAPYGFVELTVEFFPQRNGFFSADLLIESNDLLQPRLRVPLQGSSGPAPSVTPARLDFGEVAPGGSKTERVTLANHQSSILSLTSVTTSDPRFVPTAGFSDLHPGNSAVVEVRFQPTDIAQVRGFLMLSFAGPEATEVVLALSGAGQ